MNQGIKRTMLVITMLLYCIWLPSQESITKFSWPDTPASKVYQAFINAYNTGDEKKVRGFVKKWYKKTDDEYVYNKVDTWMDYFYRYGEVTPHSITINQSHDLEIWLMGNTSKAWFAVEFVLDEDMDKVRGVGVLQGEIPEGLALGSENEVIMLDRFKNYLEVNEEAGLFQGSVLLQKGDEVLVNQAYGYKDIDQKIKNSTDTRFDFMSITKLITAVACMQLVQQGLLDLDASVDTYLPDLPKHIASQITLRMLLSHTSGYELDGIEGFRDELQGATSMSQVYQLQLKYLPNWEYYDDFKPTGKYDYANDSFDLAAIMLEKVTGMKFEDYLQKYVFDLVGAKSISFEDKGAALRYRYDLSVEGLMDFSSYYPYGFSKVNGAGGLIGTAEDLRRFFNALLYTNKLLDFVHRNMMFSPQVFESRASNVSMTNAFISVNNEELKAHNGYGLGVKVSYNGSMNVGHGGTNIGSNTEMKYFPDSDYLLIVLANNRSGASNVFNYFRNNLPRN